MNYLEIEKEMTKTYNAIASKYEKEAKEDWKDKKYINKFLKYLKYNASILDIGCGTGELLKYYNDMGLDTTGIDISKEKISEVIRKINERLTEDGKIFILFTTSLNEGLQTEPLDSNYKYYVVNYSVNEICNALLINGFEILESEEITRTNKSNVGVIIARKQKK